MQGVYINEKEGYYAFKPEDFLRFLNLQKQFKHFGTTELHARLTAMGVHPERLEVDAKNKNVKVWMIDIDTVKRINDEQKTIVDMEFEVKDYDF